MKKRFSTVIIAFVFTLLFGCNQISNDSSPDQPKILKWSNSPIRAMTLSPDGKSLAIGTDAGVFLYDSETLESKASITTPASILSFHPTGQILAIGYDGMVQFWNLETKQFSLFAGEAYEIGEYLSNQITFSQDGQFLAFHTYTFGCDGVGSGFELWDVLDKRLILKRKDCLHWEKPIFSFSQDSQNLILGFNDYSSQGSSYYVDVINVQSGKVLSEHKNIQILAISADGQYVTYQERSDDTAPILVVDLNNMNIVNQYNDIISFIFSPVANYALITFNNGDSRLQTIKADKVSCDFANLEFTHVDFNADGNKVVLWNKWSKKDAYIWDTTKCLLLAKIEQINSSTALP